MSHTKEAANRMRQSYETSGDRWFKIAADEIERLLTIEEAARRWPALCSGSVKPCCGS